MARSISPSNFNGYDDDLTQTIHYTQDISDQMRVPKRIKATGEYFDEHELLSNGGGSINSWNYHQTFDMTVPERIVVMGHEQQMGARSAPREIILDNSILPNEPEHDIRVSTPPRVISLSEHHFPSASDEPEQYRNGINNMVEIYESERRLVKPKPTWNTANDSIELSRGETPPVGNSTIEGLTPSEEVIHLRRQVAKLHRRVLAIELDAVQRQQRDKLIYCVGLAYFLMKAIMWLNRN